MTLALFDLDDTLLNGNCETEWFHFLSDYGHIEPGSHLPVFAEFDRQYLAGTLSIVDYMQFVLAPLTQHPPELIHGWHEQFISERIISNISSKSRELLQSHRDAGDFLILITASNRFNAGPIAVELGLDYLIATEPEIIDGRYTGNPVLPACLGEGKVFLLESWLDDSNHTLEGSYFYSDSHNDIPLMERASFPVAVDPDPHLLNVAATRNWRRISLRD